MSRAKLMEIIKKYHLYPEMDSVGEMLEKMREDIKLKTIDTSVTDTTGRERSVTIAFTLSYEGSDPETVKNVTNVLANLYVEEDMRTREKLAGSTTGFFEKELANLKEEVATYEAKIGKFKAEHINELPGSTGASLQRIAYLNQDLQRVNTRIRTLREKKIYLEAKITNVEPLKPVVTDEGKMASNPSERLKSLRMKLIRMQANLTPKHPDIKALKSEIAKLEAQVGKTNISAEKVKVLRQMNAEIAELKGKLGENHPDVLRLTKEAEALSRDIEAQGAEITIAHFTDENPDNPAYMNLRAQIIAATAEMESLAGDRDAIEKQLDNYQKKVEMIPLVEEEYNELTLNYESAKRKYHEVLNKLLTAKMAQEMDASQRGERFSITEPAYKSEHPYKPNRVMILLMGLVLGLGVAAVLAALKEGLDTSVKTPDSVETILGVPVLATVSYFDSPEQKRSRWLKRMVLASAILAFILVGSFIVDRYVMSIDLLQAKFEDRLIEMGVPIKEKTDNL